MVGLCPIVSNYRPRGLHLNLVVHCSKQEFFATREKHGHKIETFEHCFVRLDIDSMISNGIFTVFYIFLKALM